MIGKAWPKRERRALGQDGQELSAWLESRAGYFLAEALRITGRVRGQLLGEWLAAGSGRRVVKRSNPLPGKSPATATSNAPQTYQKVRAS